MYDIPTHYKKIGEGLVNVYINVYDSSDYSQLESCYHPEAKITFIEEEIVGCINFIYTACNNYGITKFKHRIDSIDSQPLGDKTMMVMMTGLIVVNEDYTTPRHFSEVLLLTQKQNGDFLIINSIFRLIS